MSSKRRCTSPRAWFTKKPSKCLLLKKESPNRISESILSRRVPLYRQHGKSARANVTDKGQKVTGLKKRGSRRRPKKMRLNSKNLGMRNDVK